MERPYEILGCILLYLHREEVPARLRYNVFTSKLKVLRYTGEGRARVEMWVILHAYAHSCSRSCIRMTQ